jgi:hypothetical protein
MNLSMGTLSLAVVTSFDGAVRVIIMPNQQRSVKDAPPCTTIAQTMNMNGERLARLLLAPHPKMAKLALSRSAVDDIAAYIASLKK